MMTKEDTIKMATEAGMHLATDVNWMPIIDLSYAQKFAELVAAAERNKVAQWIMACGYATGHGDTVEDLLKEFNWQVREEERELCAQICEQIADAPSNMVLGVALDCAAAIRARGEK